MSRLTNQPPGIAFIVSWDTAKFDPKTRKLIRSHVRLGRGRAKDRSEGAKAVTQRGRVGTSVPVSRAKLEELIKVYTPQVPGRVGSDLSFIEFADDLEPSMILNICKVSPVAARIIYPLISAIGLQVNNEEQRSLIGQDIAGIHITAFAIEEFINKVLYRQEGGHDPAAMLHLHKGLMLLRERLSGEDDDAKVSDPTISVVLKLANAALFDGDYGASTHHLEGIRQMVEIRGGLDSFRGKQLLVEICRCDLATAVLGGTKPVFFSRPLDPMMPYPKEMLPVVCTGNQFDDDACHRLTQGIDTELATAWRVMKRFCMQVNVATQTNRLMRPAVIHETMTAVMYNLLRMGFATGSVAEAIRLGLLAYSYHVFLQWQDIQPHKGYFSVTYRNSVLHLEGQQLLPPRLLVWLLITGAVSVVDNSDQDWLGSLIDNVEKCRLKTWGDMQALLRGFMWIPVLDEERGKRLQGHVLPIAK